MADSPQLQRAFVLHQQGRHELAEKELRLHLAEFPSDAFALGLLAITLAEMERRDDAEQAAREAISAQPDFAFAHYAIARVLSDRNRDVEAAAAIDEAIRLEPEDADYRAMQASIEFGRRNWPTALQAAEAGLQFDPEHVGCNNLRAMALAKLGRKVEAGDALSTTLAREPENSYSHANKGWSLLEMRQRKPAMNHFREALRIDPANDWARAGLVEAIKSGNPVYAVMLRYFLWMQKLSSNVRWAILIGGYLGNQALSSAGAANPGLRVITTPLRILYFVFAILTWLAHPVFNLLLFVHPFGRHALNREQRVQALLVGGCLGLGLTMLGMTFALHEGGRFLIAALVFGLLSLPVAAIHACHEGWPRWAMIGIVALLAGLGLTAGVIDAVWNPMVSSDLGQLCIGTLNGFIWGVMLSQWVANWLIIQKPTR